MENKAIENRYEFVMLFDVENGNPNGDPDAGNMPRTDPETSLGIVTDVCLKRKIRNFVELYKEGEPGYNILIKADKALNTKFAEAYEALNLEKNQKGKNTVDAKRAQKYICDNYFDVRTFGAVMTTFVKGALNCGQVRGPVQLSFARSVDPVLPQEVTITRIAITTEADAERKGTEMGRKYVIPYGLYRAEGYVSANLARKTTGFSEDDLQLLSGKLTFMVQRSTNSSFTNPETVKTYTATNLGSWTPNEDGSWTLSARISMKDQELGNYYRIAESGAELDGFNLTVTDENAAVQLRSTTDADFTFTNAYADAGRALKLTKIVNAPDTTGSFTFTVSYTDAGGKPKTESVTLKNGQSTTITGIPKGVQVTVTETTTDGYTVIMKDPSTGTVLAGSSSYTFTMSDDTAMDIYNTSIVALPETGGIGRGIFLYAGIGLMLTAVITGCLLRRKYGKEGD